MRPRTEPGVSGSRRGAGGRDKPKSKKSDVATLLLFGRVRELALYRAEVLRHHGYEVIIPHTKAEAISVILAGGFDAAILTYTLSTETVEELADLIRQNCPNCPVICVSQSKTTDARIRPDEIVLAEQAPRPDWRPTPGAPQTRALSTSAAPGLISQA